MSAPRRRHLIVALVSFTAAVVAAWFTAAPPAAAPAQRIVRIPLRSESPAAAGEVADTSPAGALAAAERALAEEFDPPGEHFTGEKLAELCLAGTVDLAGEDPAERYARFWAMESPREMFDWLQRRGSFDLPYGAPPTRRLDIAAVVFTEWAGQDAGTAMQAALTCSPQMNRGPAVRMVVSAVQRTDPPRAVAFMAEHMEFFRGDLPLSAKEAGYRATWEAITKLPAGSSRTTLMGLYFDDLWKSRREESVRIWQELPAELRADLVTGSFKGASAMLMGVPVPQPIPELEGMDEMRRRHVETTGDTAAAAHFVASRSGREWAQRDPAAAVAWAQQYLKGEARVKATARLFCPAAEENFNAALKVLQALPPGMLRVRAIGNLAAGAPAEHAPEVKALLATLQGDDLRLAGIIQSREESDAQLQRILKKQETRRRLEE